MPVSSSKTNRTPSGALLTKSLTSLATLANVLGGKFSELPVLECVIPPLPLDVNDEVVLLPLEMERDDDRREVGFEIGRAEVLPREEV